MGRLLILVCLILVVDIAWGQSHGLRFSSHEVVPEKRTSLNLSADGPLCCEKPTTIGFDLSFTPHLETYFGYIIRLVSDNSQNIDIVYNQRLLQFNAVIGDTVVATFAIDSVQLHSQWSRFTISLDPNTHEAAFYLGKDLKGKGRANLDKRTCYQVRFGTSELAGFKITDIPPMNIRDIHIEQNKQPYINYPLNETSGVRAFDQLQRSVAQIENPIWIKPRHQNWKHAIAIHTKGVASAAFDKDRELLYIVSKDTLFQYAIRSGQLTPWPLTAGRDTLPPGNQSVYNNGDNKLYNIDIDAKEVSTWQPSDTRWSNNFTPGPLTIYWQANKFLSPADSSLYIIGGYGQLQYRNEVQRYHIPSKEWESIDTKGDFFMPRYLAALGASETGDTAWIMGGFGSKTGDQSINPKYTYELLAFDVKDRSFKSIYHLPDPAAPFCFANSMIIDAGAREYYALTHPIDRFNSSLQLIRGSLKDPRYELMADTIPYAFHDIESFANLYYSAASQQLVAVTIFTNKQNESSVKVYTLDFPPNKIEATPPPPKPSSNDWIWFLVAGGFIAGSVVLLMRKRKHRPVVKEEAVYAPVPVTQPARPTVAMADNGEAIVHEVAAQKDAAAIHLFGPLEVFDREGNDITKLFTPLLRELFLLMLTYTVRDGKGITSEKLYEILWSDKPLKDARNNFSVNVVKLKGILEKVGEWHVGKESGKWKLEVMNDSVKIDYQQFAALVATPESANKQYIQQLIQVAGRGNLLSTIHYNWLDDIKSEVSGRVIDILLDYLSRADLATDAEFIIRVANCMFLFDQLNEDALVWKCKGLTYLGRHGLAKEVWVKYAKEYRENYGQDFDRPFTDITGQ